MNFATLEQTDEASLLESAQNRDVDALCELLRRHGPSVRRTLQINPRWNSLLEVDDVMQVTYFEAFDQIDQFASKPDSFRPWLARIAANNLANAIQWLERKKRPQPQKRLNPPPGEDSAIWLYEFVSASTTSPSASASRNEARVALESELRKLPADYAGVIRHIYFDEKSVPEVARILGRSKGAVHLLRSRAIDRLRKQMGSSSRFLTDG